jgi:hypothetical protein
LYANHIKGSQDAAMMQGVTMTNGFTRAQMSGLLNSDARVSCTWIEAKTIMAAWKTA